MGMFNNKDKNIEIFNDTTKIIYDNDELVESIKESIANTRIYTDDINIEGIKMKGKWQGKKGRVFLEDNFTIDSAIKHCNDRYKTMGKMYPPKKVCILNFASAKNPGGMVKQGSAAQEEAICRASTLYYVLSMNGDAKKLYYSYHKKECDNLYSDRIIYTPGIKVIKDDKHEVLDKPYTIDVITCPAPNLRNGTSLNEEELMELYKKRIEKIFKVAIINDEDVLILGAWGCGVFKNPPRLMATAFRDMTKEYHHYFFSTIFSIPGFFTTENGKIFYDVFANYPKLDVYSNL